MKNSIYNTFINYDDKIILHNGFSGKFMMLEPILYRLYKSSVDENKIEKLKEIHSNFYNNLVNRGFLVDRNIDEVDRCIEKLNQIDNDDSTYHLIINPTMNCNFKCWYCYEKHIKDSKIDPKTKHNIIEYVERIVLNKLNLKYFALSWFGGEPLLQFKNVMIPLIEEIEALCKKNNIIFSSNITTNGLLISDEVLEISNKYNLNHFQITLDGYRDRHNKVRYISENKGSYDTIVENIKKLLQNKIGVIVRINCSKETFHDLEKILEDFSNITDDMKKYLVFGFHQVWQEEEDTTDNMISFMHLFRKLGFKISSNNVKNIQNTCYADKQNHTTINYNGDVFKCTAREFSNDNREGILNNEGNVLWNDKYKKRFDKKYTNKPCLECSIFPVCKGGCSQHSLENEYSYCIHGDDNNKKNKTIMELFLSQIDNVKKTLLLVLLIPILSIGQNFKIKGNIVGVNNEKLEYANIILKKDSVKIIKSATTDKEGKFIIEGLQKERYTLQTYILGYKNYKKEIEIKEDINLGDIKLEKDDQLLDEIELSTQAPLVKSVGDKLVVNVADNIFAKGRRADQFLNYTPFITANEQEGITLMNSTPIVLINDRRVYMDGRELLDFLKSISAEDIKSIEIYTNPPARFDAEGTAGVINININKQALMGMKGSIEGNMNLLREDMGGRRGILQGAELGGNLSYRDEKWYISTILRYSKYFTPNLNTSNVDFLEKGNGYDNFNEYQADYTGKSFQFNIGRDINKDHNVIFNYRYRNLLNDDESNYINNEFNSDKDITNITKGNISVIDNTDNHVAGINYNWDIGNGEKLMIIGDYYGTYGNRNQDIMNVYFKYGVDTSYNRKNLYIGLPISSNILATQIDYTLPIEEMGNFGFGGKYTSSSIESKTDYYNVINADKVKDDVQSIDFTYTENITAIYGSYSMGGLNVGLRYEYTNANYNDRKVNKKEDRSYGGFFPSISYTQPLFEKRDALTFSYNRRLNRPRYSDFNGLFYISENQLIIGYPEIRPSFPNRVQLTYNLMKKYIIIGEIVYTSDDINSVSYQVSNNSIVNQRRNIDNYYVYALSTNINQPIYDWWSINFSGRINYNKVKGEFMDNNRELIKISDDGIFSKLSLKNMVSFYGYNVELIADYIPEGKSGYREIHERYRFDLSIMRNFLDNKLSMMLYFADIFKTDVFNSTSYVGNTVSYYRKEAVPMIHISIRYNFEYGRKDGKDMRSKSSIEEEMKRAG